MSAYHLLEGTGNVRSVATPEEGLKMDEAWLAQKKAEENLASSKDR